MDTDVNRLTPSSLTPASDTGSHSGGPDRQGKVESRLSILALLAPTSAGNSPPQDYLDYRLPSAPKPANSHLDHAVSSQLPNDAASNKAAKLQALLPRPSEQRPQPPMRLKLPPVSMPRQAGVAVPRRIATIVACENCRAKRTKCDGARPKCSRCARIGTDCEYDAGPDETRSIARKRKYEEMKHDLSDMQELYEYLRTRPLVEVAEVIRRIRSNTDPCKVLRLVRDGDLLLEASAIGRKGLETDVEHVVRKLDTAAYQACPIKVPAKPWTCVAGNGLVSELVYIFFDIEQPFATIYVDKQCFLDEMVSEHTGNTNFCSPALVNAICAIGAFTSKTAKAIDEAQGGCIRESFFAEAKKQLDLEHGKVSLPTVMALYSLFLYSSEAGIDRAGSFYRVSCCEMYKKLRLGSEFPSWIDKSGTEKREQHLKATSRAAWGLFCVESISSFVYIQPALIAPPTLPRIFDCGREGTPTAEEVSHNMFFDAECSVSTLLYEVMCYNRQNGERLGKEDDISARLIYYRKLLDWRAPPRGSRVRGMFGLAQSLCLEAYFSIAVIALFRPLAPLDIALPNELGSPAKLCVEHCTRMVERTRELDAAYPDVYAEGCIATLYFFYVCSISLVQLLDKEPTSHEPFVEACRYFHLVSKNFPVAPALLRGLQALALETGVTLPRQCEEFFSTASLANKNFRDVPISYVIPQNVSKNTSAVERTGVELGNLIEKWSSTMNI